MIFQVFIFHFHDFGVPRSLESRHLLFGDIAVCGILLVCIGPVQKEQFLHLPNFGLKDDRSGNAKTSRPWNIFDSLHSNPQTGLARYNEIFDRDAFVYDRTRTWRQHDIPQYPSVFSHLKHSSLIHHWRSRACQEPFWQREIHKLLELLVPAPLACCQGLTSMPRYAFPANVCMSQSYSMSQVYTVCEYWNAPYACLL